MTRAVAASQLGLDYQARFFWNAAAVRLLDDASPVSRVGFEVDDNDGFDDVVVERSTPDRDEFGRSISRDCYQVKFHVDAAGALTAEGLCDPKEIGGTARSLLQRLQRAHHRLGDEVATTRLHLVTTYPIDLNDPLAKLHSSNEGGIRMGVFQAGGPRSEMGKLRKRWRDHLELGSDEELVQLLLPLRFWRSAPDYARLRDELEPKLSAVGLRVEQGDAAQDRYEQLIWRLNREGHYYFEADALRHECEKAELAAQAPAPAPAPAIQERPKIAVRSFRHPSVDLADSSDRLLSLLEHFDGRFIKEAASWEHLEAELDAFYREATTEYPAFDLQLDTHASLAFASGALLEAKLGIDLRILQRGRAGLAPWDTSTNTSGVPPDTDTEDVEVRSGPDVALALAITHDIVSEVEHHVRTKGLPIGRIIAIRPQTGSSQAAITGPAQALSIADDIARIVKARSPAEKRARLHLFAAAPNALIFFLAQLSRSFGSLTLYEHDFEQTRGGGYEPSLCLPISRP